MIKDKREIRLQAESEARPEGPSLEFRLLGPVECVIAGRPIDPGPPSRLAVLAALLYDTGRPVPLDVLASRVWDEIPPSAQGSLYSHISRLRQTFAQTDSTVRISRRVQGYVLEAPSESVDFLRFQNLVRRSQNALSGDEGRAQLLGDALDLWRGEALTGVSSSWALSVREALVEQHLAAAALWAQAEGRLGRPDLVVSRLSSLLVQYPLAESLAFELIRALHVTGRRAEALDWCIKMQRRLADELGVEPGPELRELHLSILRDREGPQRRSASRGPRSPRA